MDLSILPTELKYHIFSFVEIYPFLDEMKRLNAMVLYLDEDDKLIEILSILEKLRILRRTNPYDEWCIYDMSEWEVFDMG